MVEITKIDEFTYKIAKQGKMNVDVRIFASDKLMEKIKEDKTLNQAMNMASLPGVLNPIIVCPDAHEGYGACIGGVSAMNLDNGVISPGEIGYDINCSVRILRTNLTLKDIKGKEKSLTHELFRATPNGVGSKSKTRLSEKELDEVLETGINWCLKNNFAQKEQSNPEAEEDWIYTLKYHLGKLV